VLLTTLLTEDHYYLILTTPDKQIARSQKIRLKEITNRVDVLRRTLRDTRTRGAYMRWAKELYLVLVGPIAGDLQRLKAKTLLLSLDGELRYVPFGVLHDGESFLVEKYVARSGGGSFQTNRPEPRLTGGAVRTKLRCGRQHGQELQEERKEERNLPRHHTA
jgi:CHAT domain-containing protein